MNRNLLAGLVVGAILISGGFVLMSSRNDDDEPNQNSEQSEVNNQSASGFSPISNSDRDVIAIISQGAGQGQAEFAYDADKKAVRYSAITEDQEISFINSPDGYFIQANGTWLKYPEGNPIAVDTQSYQYTNEELRTFQNSAINEGTESCGSKTCSVWKFDQAGVISKFYLETDTNLIIKIETESNGQSSTIEYRYEDVDIEIPTEYQEVPGL